MTLLHWLEQFDLRRNPPRLEAATAGLHAAAEKYGCSYPEDYASLRYCCDGFRCCFPSGAELELWPFTELLERNELYAIDDLAPHLLLIGTEYGGEGLALDRSSAEYILLPLIGLEIEYAQVRSETLRGVCASLLKAD